MNMTIDQIKEWRNHKRLEDIYGRGCAHVIDILLAEVGRLEKQCAQYKDEGNRMIDGLFDLNAKLTSTEQKLAVATEVLYAVAVPYKDGNMSREDMIELSRDALKQMEVGNE